MKQLDNMWLRRINSSGDEFRYELETFYTAPLLLDDGNQTQCFVMYKYYKNNYGEFELCKSNEKVYVTIETLLSQFVQIDSQIDNTLKNLQEFKRNVQAKNLEDSLAPFYVGVTQEVDGVDLGSADLSDSTMVPNGEY